MPRIRMLAAITGTRNGEPWPEVGEEADVTEAEAVDMITAGLAEVGEEADVTASKPEPKSRAKR